MGYTINVCNSNSVYSFSWERVSDLLNITC